MARNILQILIIVLFCVPTQACALTWDEALGLAGKNNNDIIGAKKQADSSGWAYNRAYTVFFPQLSANMGMSETIAGSAEFGSKSYSYGLSATQHIFNGFDDIFGLQTSYSEYQYSLANLENTKAGVYYEVRSAFVDLLVSEKNIELLERILEQRRENARLIKLRYESGKEDRGNYMQTEADVADAEYNLSSARKDLKLAQLRISQLLDREVASVEAGLEVSAPAEPDVDSMIKSSPSLVMAKYQLETAEIAKRATVSGFLPSLSLSGNWGRRGPDWPPEDESKSWSLNLSYSFFPGGSNFIDVAVYDARLEKAKQDYESAVKDLTYSVEESYEGFKNSIEALKVRGIALDAANERAKIARAKYLNGLLSFDEWNRVENEDISAQRSLLSSKKSALLAEAMWHRSYGGYVK